MEYPGILRAKDFVIVAVSITGIFTQEQMYMVVWLTLQLEEKKFYIVK